MPLSESEFERIAERTRRMLDEGWADETRAIRERGGFGPTAIQALGYAEVLQWIDGELDRDACEARIAQRTRQFARRQRTWFRRFPEIHWLEGADADELAPHALRELGWSSGDGARSPR